MNRDILLVGIGGFAGSVLRYLVTIFLAERVSASFPFGTLTANITGCFLIGVILGFAERGSILSPEWRILLTTGFCGGFTTFSTFSYESLRLVQDGEFLYLFLNVWLNVVVGLGATYLGLVLMKSI